MSEYCRCFQFKSAIILALAASASAFAPMSQTSFSTKLYDQFSGKYEGQVWDMDAKTDVYNSWDPNTPRSSMNFNPFETFEGNSPDTNGFFPGEGRYKDPVSLNPHQKHAVVQKWVFCRSTHLVFSPYPITQQRPDVNYTQMMAGKFVGKAVNRI